MSGIAGTQPTIVQYNVAVDENGDASGTGNWNSAAPQLPPHLAKRLAASKKLRKKGTPQERESAVEARRRRTEGPSAERPQERVSR